MLSSWQTFVRIVTLGQKNFWRNRWLTLGATLLMTLTLTMISVSLLMTLLLRDSASAIRSKIDLTIYFRDDVVTDVQILSLGDRIKALPGVQSIHFVNKTEALRIWDRLPINDTIKKPVTAQNNPLPRSLEIKTTNPDQIQTIATSALGADTEKLICNECVSYTQNKDTVNRLVSVTRFVQLTGLFLSIFFGVIAIFNVFNIIRITIMARSDEIEIMRYVGASNAFVRGPFIIEGITYGLLATIITTVFLLGGTWAVSHYLGSSSTALSFLQLINVNFFQYILDHLWLFIGSQLAIGVLLGILVSVLSIRRYLKA